MTLEATTTPDGDEARCARRRRSDAARHRTNRDQDKARARAQKWRANNPEKARASARRRWMRWYADPANMAWHAEEGRLSYRAIKAARAAAAGAWRASRIMSGIASGRIKPAEAASFLGVARSTILRRCKELGINPKAARARFVARLVARAHAAAKRTQAPPP